MTRFPSPRWVWLLAAAVTLLPWGAAQAQPAGLPHERFLLRGLRIHDVLRLLPVSECMQQIGLDNLALLNSPAPGPEAG